MNTILYNGFYINIDYGTLTTEEREHNGMKIAQQLYNLGWTENAIAGLLGNTSAESTMNPGCIESNPTHPRPPEWTYLPTNQIILESSYDGGIGLTQWTPGRTKIVAWAESTGRVWCDGMAQVFMLKHESEDGIQMTATQWNYFIHSEDDPADLAEYFLRQYEKPSPEQIEESLENRRRGGTTWYRLIHGHLFKMKLYLGWNPNKRKELKPRCLRV